MSAAGGARRCCVLVAIAILGGVAALGCSGSGGEGSAGGGAAPTSKTPVSLVEGVSLDLRVLDNRFVPAEVNVKAGTEIRFVNDGRNDHNVTPASDPGATGFDFKVATEDLLVGKTATVRFTEPGRYAYYCSIHGTAKAGMTGTIVVQG